MIMIIPNRQRRSNSARIWKLIIKKFKGVATALDDVILGISYAKAATNLIQKQDGRWAVRPGTASYGLSIPEETTIVGAGVYTAANGEQKIVAVGGSGKAYVSTDGGSWSEISGATFSTTADRYWFEMAGGYLLIANGEDRLTRYDGSTLSRWNSILAPTGLAGTRNVLTAGSYQNLYKVTALNSVGETAGSAEVNITTNKERNSWISTSNEYITLTWNAVVGATRYQIYWASESGKEILLDSVETNSYKDDASAVANASVLCPDFDTTGLPAFSIIRKSETRLIAIDPKNYPSTVFFSGTGQYFLSFADAYGGGWVKLDEGSGEKVSYVGHFRTGKGDPAPTILTETPSGTGSIWQISFIADNSTGEAIIIPSPSKIVGSIGTTSPLAVVEADDSLVFPNARGMYMLNNRQNVTNILSTENMSANIRPTFSSLLSLRNMCGYWYDDKIIFSASEGGTENDIVFGYDTVLNEWFFKWTIGFRQFLEYTDSSGKTRFLGVPVSGSAMKEISENIKGDDGVSFKTSYISGLIPVDDDETVFARVKEAMVVLGRPKGSIVFEVFGLTDKKGFSLVASRQVSNTLVVNEFWSGDLGEITLLDEEDSPTTFSQASVKTAKKVNKRMNSIQFHISSDSLDAEYTLLKLQATGVIQPLKTPSAWLRR